MTMKAIIKKHPTTFLIVLSPILAELASGSTPVFRFFHPSGLLLGLGFYGLGALIIREIAAHKRLGYTSVLLFGAAFGVLEEGLLLKSWFDPSWGGAGILAKSLEIGGLIPFMPLMLIPYHAVISITTPVILVESCTLSKEAWLSRKLLLFTSIVFIIFSLVFSGKLGSKVHLQAWQFIFTLALFVGFSLIGLKPVKQDQSKNQTHFSQLCIMGFLFLPLQASIFWLLSGIGVSWVVILILSILMYWFYAKIFSQNGWQGFTSKQLFGIGLSFAAGTIPFSIFIALQNPTKFLNTLSAIAITLILFWIYRRFTQTSL